MKFISTRCSSIRPEYPLKNFNLFEILARYNRVSVNLYAAEIQGENKQQL